MAVGQKRYIMRHHVTSQSRSGMGVASEVQYDVTIGMFRVRCHSAGNVAEGRWSAKNRSRREDRSQDLGYEGSRGVISVAEVKWSGGSIVEVKQSGRSRSGSGKIVQKI